MRAVLILAALLNVGDEPPYVGRWAASPERCEAGNRTMIIRRDQFSMLGDPGSGCVFERVQPLDDDGFAVDARCRNTGNPEVQQQFTFRMHDEEMTVERPGKPTTPPMMRCDED